MARPTEFDRDIALDAALRIFWRQGYLATSLQELLESMKISRSSFYAAFGDKRSLFAEVLMLFSERTRAVLIEARAEVGAVDSMRRFFYSTLLDVPRYRSRRGCMMVNTILELAEVDPELSETAARELGQVESLFESYFREAQEEGDYPTERTAKDLAAQVMLLNQGIRVASRKPISRTELKKQIDTAVSFLGLPASV